MGYLKNKIVIVLACKGLNLVISLIIVRLVEVTVVSTVHLSRNPTCAQPRLAEMLWMMNYLPAHNTAARRRKHLEHS